MVKVTIDNCARMNLLGLMLGDVIARNAQTPEGQQALALLSGDIVVRASQMAVTLAFRAGKLTIYRDAVADARAELHGSMDTLIKLGLGRSPLISLLSGKLAVRGSPLALLRLRPLLRPRAPASDGPQCLWQDSTQAPTVDPEAARSE